MPVWSSGVRSFTTCGRSLPSVADTNSCVTLYFSGSWSGINSHVPVNSTSLSSTVLLSLSYFTNFQVPSFTFTSFVFGSVGVTSSPFTLPVWFAGSWSSTSCGSSLFGSLLTNLWVTLYFPGSGSGVNSHVPVTFSSLLEIVTSFLSYDLNVHVPLFTSSLNVASEPVGTGDFTVSPFTLPFTSSGAFAFNSAGNSTPFVPLTYS